MGYFVHHPSIFCLLFAIGLNTWFWLSKDVFFMITKKYKTSKALSLLGSTIVKQDTWKILQIASINLIFVFLISFAKCLIRSLMEFRDVISRETWLLVAVLKHVFFFNLLTLCAAMYFIKLNSFRTWMANKHSTCCFLMELLQNGPSETLVWRS